MKLPLNCEVDYLNNFLELKDANELFDELYDVIKKLNFNPQTDDGKKYDVNFGKVMFLDQNLLDENKFPEEHWGPTKFWTDRLKTVKEKIEKI